MRLRNTLYRFPSNRRLDSNYARLQFLTPEEVPQRSSRLQHPLIYGGRDHITYIDVDSENCQNVHKERYGECEATRARSTYHINDRWQVGCASQKKS